MSKEKAEKVIGLFLGFGSAVRCQSVPHPLVGNLKVPVETRTALRFRCTCSFLFPQVFVWPQITPLALPALTSFRAHLICIGSSTLSMSVCSSAHCQIAYRIQRQICKEWANNR